MDVFPAYLIVAALLGLIPAAIARSKGHSFMLEWLIALCFSPLLALVHSIIMRPKTRRPARRSFSR